MGNSTTGSSSDIAPIGAIEVNSQNLVSSEDKRKKKLTPEEKEEQRRLQEKRDFLQGTCKISLRHAADARRRYDYEWMVRDLFRRGYQFSRYQPTTQTVILASRQTARIPVNIVAAQMRSIRNQVTSFRPKFEVLPRYTSEESRVQARYAGKLLDYYFDHLNFKKKIKETVVQGLMYSVGGPWQIIYDEQKKEIKVWTLDPFDFYFDPLATELEDAEYVIKAVRRPVGEIIYNQEYDELARKEVIGGEARLAVSEYKQFMIQALKYVTQYNRQEAPTLILFEGDFKIRNQNTGKVHIRKVVWTDQNFTPLYWEDTDEEEYDYVIYQADLNPRDILGESWMKHVLPINRVINSLESSVYDYNYRVAKGRIVVDRDSGVRAIHNVHGEIISKNKGSEVRALDMPPLPVATSTQIDRMYRYIEDIGGAHDASLGRVPAGVKSGIGIAELRQADACVDTKTQALTKKGWKNFDELSNENEIYVFDPESKKLKWGKLNKIFEYDKQDADVYEFETKNISALSTPDHSWMVVNPRGNWSKQETQTLKNDQYIPLIAESESLTEEKVYEDNFVRLISWVVTEGSYSKNNGRAITIYQSEENWDKVEKIKLLFEKLEIDREPYQDNKNCWQFVFAGEYAKQIREMFPNKTLTMDFVNKLTKDQLEILIDTMIMGDGHVRESGRRCFINTKKETIDSLQLACILLGISTSIGEYDDGDDNHSLKYVLYLKETTKISIGKIIDKGQLIPVKFTGKVWCPNTDVGFWLARRNGKVFITGNTNQDDLVDNLEDFLSDVGKKILKKISKNYSTIKIIKDLGYREEESQYFAVVGSSARVKERTDFSHKGQVKIGPDWLDLAVIGEDNNVRVTVGSWLGYTKEMMQEKTIKLLQLGAIDQKTFLRLWEFGDIDQIVQQTRIESLLKKQQTGTQQPGEVDQYGLAMTENEMMINEFKDMPVDQHDDHVVHIALHQDALGKGQDDLIGKHIEAHQLYLSEGPIQAVSQEDQQRNQAVQGQQSVPPIPTSPMGTIPPAGSIPSVGANIPIA